MRSCCEEKSTDKNTPEILDNLKGSGSVTVAFDTGQFNIALGGGILTAVRAALKKVKLKGTIDLGLSGRVVATVIAEITEIKADQCIDGITVKGGGNVNVTFGLSADLKATNTFQVNGTAKTGLTGETAASGAGPGKIKIESKLTWGGLKLSASVTFLTFKIKILDDFQAVNPVPINSGTATLNIPQI